MTMQPAPIPVPPAPGGGNGTPGYAFVQTTLPAGAVHMPAGVPVAPGAPAAPAKTGITHLYIMLRGPGGIVIEGAVNCNGQTYRSQGGIVQITNINVEKVPFEVTCVAGGYFPKKYKFEGINVNNWTQATVTLDRYTMKVPVKNIIIIAAITLALGFAFAMLREVIIANVVVATTTALTGSAVIYTLIANAINSLEEIARREKPYLSAWTVPVLTLWFLYHGTMADYFANKYVSKELLATMNLEQMFEAFTTYVLLVYWPLLVFGTLLGYATLMQGMTVKLDLSGAGICLCGSVLALNFGGFMDLSFLMKTGVTIAFVFSLLFEGLRNPCHRPWAGFGLLVGVVMGFLGRIGFTIPGFGQISLGLFAFLGLVILVVVKGIGYITQMAYNKGWLSGDTWAKGIDLVPINSIEVAWVTSFFGPILFNMALEAAGGFTSLAPVIGIALAAFGA